MLAKASRGALLSFFDTLRFVLKRVGGNVLGTAAIAGTDAVTCAVTIGSGAKEVAAA